MRTLLSMAIFLIMAMISAAGAQAQQQPTMSPLQSQLQKMQSGEAYGMKTVSSMPAVNPASAESQLNDNAKALANRAMAQNQVKEKTRLEKLQAAYDVAEAPQPIPAHQEMKPGDKPADKASTDTSDDSDKTPIQKSVEKTEKAEADAMQAAADAAKIRDAKMLYEGVKADQPKTPPRLIPVE